MKPFLAGASVLIGGFALLALLVSAASNVDRRAIVENVYPHDQQHKEGRRYTMSVTSLTAYEGVRVLSGWHKGVN